jgi:hypothetical protein
MKIIKSKCPKGLQAILDFNTQVILKRINTVKNQKKMRRLFFPKN